MEAELKSACEMKRRTLNPVGSPEIVVGRADSLATDVGKSDSSAKARCCRRPGVADGIEQERMAEGEPGWSLGSWAAKSNAGRVWQINSNVETAKRQVI